MCIHGSRDREKERETEEVFYRQAILLWSASRNTSRGNCCYGTNCLMDSPAPVFASCFAGNQRLTVAPNNIHICRLAGHLRSTSAQAPKFLGVGASLSVLGARVLSRHATGCESCHFFECAPSSVRYAMLINPHLFTTYRYRIIGNPCHGQIIMDSASSDYF